MLNIGITDRLNTYLKYLGRYSLGFGLYSLFLSVFLIPIKSTNLKAEVNKEVAIIILILSLLIVLGTPIYLGFKAHLKIAKTFISQRSKKAFLFTMPVFTIWLVLLTFKIYINEVIYYGHLIDELPDIRRFFNYFFFAIWTFILWWEICYYIIRKLIQKENGIERKYITARNKSLSHNCNHPDCH